MMGIRNSIISIFSLLIPASCLPADLSADSAFVAEATSAKGAVLTKAESPKGVGGIPNSFLIDHLGVKLM